LRDGLHARARKTDSCGTLGGHCGWRTESRTEQSSLPCFVFVVSQPGVTIMQAYKFAVVLIASITGTSLSAMAQGAGSGGAGSGSASTGSTGAASGNTTSGAANSSQSQTGTQNDPITQPLNPRPPIRLPANKKPPSAEPTQLRNPEVSVRPASVSDTQPMDCRSALPVPVSALQSSPSTEK
jgi:hypothetical protein